MKLTDFRNKAVRTLDGKGLGRVHEVHCDDGALVALKTGPGSLWERLTSKNAGERILWKRVVRIEPKQIVVAPDQPKGKPRKKR